MSNHDADESIVRTPPELAVPRDLDQRLEPSRADTEMIVKVYGRDAESINREINRYLSRQRRRWGTSRLL